MKKVKFVGFIEPSDHNVLEVLMSKNWKTDLFDLPPLTSLETPPSYLLTLGSGIYPSLATINPQGMEYYAGFDIFRGDFDSRNLSEPLVNIDHYIVSSIKSSVGTAGIFKIPEYEYHWPKLQDPIIQELPQKWAYTIQDMLNKKK